MRPPQASNSTLIIFLAIGGAAVIAVVGYIAMGGSGGDRLSREQERRYEDLKKTERQVREDEEDERAQKAAGTYKEPDPNEINVRGRTVEDQVGNLLMEAKRLAWEQKKLDKAEEALNMALEKGPDYKGDILHMRGQCQTEYAQALGTKGAALAPYWDKKLEYFRQAKEAYAQLGAKTTYNESVEQRVTRMETLIQMGERQKTSDVAK